MRLLLQVNSFTQSNVQRDWLNNIAGTDLQQSICGPEIDIVYTWVNGTDPRLIEALSKARQAIGDTEHLCNRDNTTATNSSTNSTSSSASKKKCLNDADSLSRFIDNEELRYSLRSVERFAPWVRNIYIVTNGQIPSWLDLSHPRMKIVTHEMLFLNRSHLPTFSSPAIETHLHRIPGLSKKFLYLNDDTMFGAEVWPDDFFTSGKGQKIYLAWPVPDCNDGCPASWISDGYCDQACNVSACNFDGGDCANASAPRFSSFGNSNWGGWRGGDSTNDYCSWGCPNSWVGDKYCDRPCQNPECGMDGGDCGMDTVYTSVYGINITSEVSRVEVPFNKTAMYIGLRGIINDARIVDGSHDNPRIVRTATISQKHKTMVLTFHRNVTLQEVTIAIVAMDGSDKIEKSFNLSVATRHSSGQSNDTKEAQGNDTVSSVKAAEGEEDEGRPWESIENAKIADEGDPWDNTFNAAARDLTEEDREDIIDDFDNFVQDDDYYAYAAGRRGLLSLQPDDQGETRFLRKKNPFAPKPIIDPHWERDRKLAHRSRINREMHDLSQPPLFPWELGPSSSSRDLEENPGGRRGRRQLLDAFGDSLRFVNRLLDQEFGRDSRRVIAHMPHMIDRDVVNAMHAKWPEQFEATSSHQFRHPNDMQFAFSHYYFLMSQRSDFDIQALWKSELDLDGSGYLDENELRTISARINGVNQKKFEDLKDTLRDGRCRRGLSSGDNDTYGDGDNDTMAGSNITATSGDASPAANSSGENSPSPSSSASSSPSPSSSATPSPSELLNAILERRAGASASASASRTPTKGTKAEASALKDWRSRMRTQVKGRASGSPRIVPETDTEEEATMGDETVEDAAVASEEGNGTAGGSNSTEKDDGKTEEERKKEAKKKKELEEKERKEEEERKRDEAIAREDPIRVSLNDLLGCDAVLDKIYEHYTKKTKNKFEVVPTEDDVAFLMVNANATTTRQKLDGIRQKPRKFVCINDDIDHSDPRSVTTLKVIRQFYQSMHPVPSSFELPLDQRNPYMYHEDYEQFLRQQSTVGEEGSHYGWLLILLSVVCICYCFYRVIRSRRTNREVERESRESRFLKFLRI